MPRRITTQNRSLASNVTVDETNSTLSLMGDVTNGMDVGEPPVQLTRTWIKEKFNSLIQNLESKKNYELRNLRLAFSLTMLEIPENLQNATIGSDYECLRSIFMQSMNNDFENSPSPAKTKTAIKRKRSESARDLKISELTAKKRDLSMFHKTRSSSVDTFKTPVNKQWLSAFTSAKKYTVSKPSRKEEDPGYSLRRIMKPNEEAISVTGSPLIVQQNIAAPTVYIPLPGGVVMNIEPKKSRGNTKVPELDKKTKCQLKILCEQLNKLV